MTYQAPTTSLRPKSRPTTVSSSPRPPSRSSQPSSSSGSGGLASPTKPKKQEEKPSMVDRFWSMFDATGGTVSEDDTTSSSERALSFYDSVDMTIPEVPQVSEPSELAPAAIDPYVGAVGTGNRDVAPNTMDSYLQGDVDIEAVMPPAAPSGLMSPPTQEDTDAAVVEAMTSPVDPSSRLDSKGGEVAGVTTKSYDYLIKAGYTPPENQLLSEKMGITSDTSGTQFTNREDALEFIDNSSTLEGTRKAAFSTTVDAESGAGLVEGTNHSLNSAIANLGGGNEARISRIRQLYGNRNRLNAEEQVTLFDIAYGGRMGNEAGEGHKYRGRGLIQITGKNNYLKYGRDIGIGDALVRDPDLLLNNPSVMLAVTEAYLKDKLPERADGLSANDLKDAIGHSGSVPRGVTWNGSGSAYKGNQRWTSVINSLEAAGEQDEADAARLNNEFAAQQKVGSYIDGDIGPNSLRTMRNWLTDRGVTIPEGTTGRELVRLVNGTD